MRSVVEPLARDYLEGRTPNPCVTCNRDFKIAVLLRWANEHRADYVATGHYARILPSPSSRAPSLLRGVDPEKDQSYFLFSLSQDQLARLLFPLGGMTKVEVREKARGFGLPVADRPDSQDICLGDYRDLVESLAQERELAGGEIVDLDGRVLGRHGGIHRMTIGQRRGLGLSAPRPLYVVGIDGDSKRVVVGGRADLDRAGLFVRHVQWIEPPCREEFSAEIQIRYRAPAVPCRVRLVPQDRIEVHFERPVPSVTPGQAAVLYQGERVLGGGWIEHAIKSNVNSQ
jgi:tRNA-specific 2-thiouridylase